MENLRILRRENRLEFLDKLLGQLGIHRFYLGRTGTGVIQLILAILGYLTLALFGIGLVFLIPLGVWLIVDIFLIPGMSNGPGHLVTTTTVTHHTPVTPTEPVTSEAPEAHNTTIE